MSNDPFSDVLRMTEATTIVSGGIAAGGTWSFHMKAVDQLVFAAIIEGGCWFRFDGHKKAMRLEKGDVGLLSGRKGFVICSSLSVPPEEKVVKERWGRFDTIGDGSGCTWLAGRVALQPASSFLLTDALPPLVLVRASSPSAASLQWIVQDLVAEQTSTRLGARIVSSQLAQLFFVKILRAHLESEGAFPRGWLRGVADPRLAHALALMHEHPGRSHGLDGLAKAAGMSRTRFAVHFKSVVGVAPLAYLTEWRMRIAQRALREETSSVAEIAQSVGYASESAFSHAFKRVTGVAPRAHRNASRA